MSKDIKNKKTFILKKKYCLIKSFKLVFRL